jgi:hypothetical protein
MLSVIDWPRQSKINSWTPIAAKLRSVQPAIGRRVIAARFG